MKQKVNKRKIKRRKIKLTKLGKQVVTSILALNLVGAGAGIALASTINKPTKDIATETTIETFEDIFETAEMLAPIISETEEINQIYNENIIRVATPTPYETENIAEEPEIINNDERLEPIMADANIEETIETLSEEENIEPVAETTLTENTTIIEDNGFVPPAPSINLSIGYSNERNTSDDILKYNTVRENYGDIIDQIALETHWDPRLITTMIAQENPFNQDQTGNGIYGITSIYSGHNGHTYPLGVFDENGNHSIRNITIDINDINTNPRSAIYAQMAILEDYLRYYDIKTNGLEVFGSYNGGPATMFGSSLNDAFNNFRNSYTYSHDHYYYSNIFYKLNALSFEGIDGLYYTNLEGETASFNITFIDELGTLSANNLNYSHGL